VRVLVTGICGFAGSTISRHLLEHRPGLQIFGIDNLCRRGSETNLEPLRSLGADIRIGDIRREEDIASLPTVDWVIDCAANPSVLAGVDGKTSAKELLDHNLGGTIHLLEYCRRNGAGFILLSTSRVYSIQPLSTLEVTVVDQAFRPVLTGQQNLSDQNPTQISNFGLTESFSTEPPISLYGSSKKCSELLALEYALTFNFPVRINRCGVLAGAGQFGKADQGIFSYWLHSWRAQRPLQYIGFGGNGYQVRDCLDPEDLVPLLLRQMDLPDHPAPAVLNISGGSGNAISLAQLSRWCVQRFGPHPSFPPSTDSRPSSSGVRPFDIPWLVLDSRAARDAWNWQPSIAIESVLHDIACHAESHPNWLDLVT